MSTRYMQVIRKKEREGFQKIKEIEHQKQCSYPLQDILYTSDFTFTFFSCSISVLVKSYFCIITIFILA